MSTPAALRAVREIFGAHNLRAASDEDLADVIDRHMQSSAFCEATRRFESWEVVHGSTLPSPACLETIRGQFGNTLKAARAAVETP